MPREALELSRALMPEQSHCGRGMASLPHGLGESFWSELLFSWYNPLLAIGHGACSACRDLIVC